MKQAFVLATLIVLLTPRAEAQQLSEVIEIFRQNRLNVSAVLFERLVNQNPGDARPLAWLAYNYYYLGAYSAAIDSARSALQLDPCNAVAHLAIANSFNPQSSDYGDTDVDTTWYHLTRAVACDSNAGDAWMGIRLEAMRRGDRAMEARSLQRLYDLDFFPRAEQAYYRWLMRDLPRNAVLLTTGDFPSYIPAVLQNIRGFRTDVAIVDIGLLNLPWYARHVRDHHGIPLVLDSAELDDFKPYYDFRGSGFGSVRTLGQVLLRGLVTDARSGRLGRPLAISRAIDMREVSDSSLLRNFISYGPWSLFTRRRTHPEIDTAATRNSLRGVTASAFTGPRVSSIDPSPIRASAEGTSNATIIGIAMEYAATLYDAGRTDEAVAMSRWAEDFCVETGTDLDWLPYIYESRKEWLGEESIIDTDSMIDTDY